MRWSLTCALCLLLAWLVAFTQRASAWARPSDHTPSLRAVSSGNHLWIALPTESGCTILHHSSEMNGAFFKEVRSLPALPAALAARENHLWIVAAPVGSGTGGAVYGLSTIRDPATGSFSYQPTGRLDVLPSLPASARFCGIAPQEDGPVVLVAQPDFALLASAPMGWQEIALSGDAVNSPMLVAWAGAAASPWAIVNVDGVDLISWTQSGAANSPPWERQCWSGAGDGFEMMITGSVRPATLARFDGASGASFLLQYITPSGPRKLTVITPPQGSWTVTGFGEGFRLISVGAGGDVQLSAIDAVTGSLTPSTPLTPQPTTTSEWIHLPLLGALTIGMLLAGFIIHPPADPPPVLCAEWVALPLPRRLIALAIDMVPGAVIAVLVTGANLDELLAMPSWTPDLARSTPSSIMLGITGVWCLLFELSLRASPGKFLVGGRIVREPVASGDPRAGLWRSGGRALLKTAVLFAPALGFLAFVHPLHQGLPETITKTVVARRR